MQFRVGVRTAATAATAGHVAASLWNGASTEPLFLREIHFANTTAASANIALRRTTARGTQTASVTPSSDHEVSRAAASVGAVVDYTYSGQPTVDADELDRWMTPAVIGAGKIWIFPRRIYIPAGAGLAVATPVATVLPVSDVTFVWDEKE